MREPSVDWNWDPRKPWTIPTEWSWVYHLCAPLPGVAPEEEVVHLYIGVTDNLRARMKQHSRKWWWASVDFKLCEWLPFHTRAEANQAERDMILDYEPEMNRHGLWTRNRQAVDN